MDLKENLEYKSKDLIPEKNISSPENNNIKKSEIPEQKYEKEDTKEEKIKSSNQQSEEVKEIMDPFSESEKVKNFPPKIQQDAKKRGEIEVTKIIFDTKPVIPEFYTLYPSHLKIRDYVTTKEDKNTKAKNDLNNIIKIEDEDSKQFQKTEMNKVNHADSLQINIENNLEKNQKTNSQNLILPSEKEIKKEAQEEIKVQEIPNMSKNSENEIIPENNEKIKLEKKEESIEIKKESS